MFQYNHNDIAVNFIQTKFFILSFLALMLLLFTILLNAWIGDDATIMFRQVWNLLSGDGITFNFKQRVQAFSNPLWFWTVSLFGFITKELYVTTTLLSVTLTILATIFLILAEYRINKFNLALISPIILLPFSWAFIDYSTSGLENALSYFLVSLLLYFIAIDELRKNLKILFFILSLLFLNRLDYAVLFLPISLYLVWFSKSIKLSLHGIYPGAILIVVWFIFATFYFGSPLPNTFYAKLNAGYPTEEVIRRGWDYFMSMKSDLVSVLIIFLGIFLSTISRNFILICLSFGQLLYMFFIFQAGGDFMLGRFFAILVFLSVGQIILALKHIEKLNLVPKNYFILTTSLLVICIGIFQRYPFLLAYDNYETRGPFYGLEYTDFHIVDEKMFYYFNYGLFSPTRENWPIIQPQTEYLPTKYFATCGSIGSKSIRDPSFFYVDQCALTDPLISRIPAVHSDLWRIGHHYRKIPTEYGEFVIGNVDKIPDNNINTLLRDIALLSSGKLNDLDRLTAIWRVNSGFYSEIDFTNYIDKNIWVPKTTKVQQVKTVDWNNIPKEIVFNGIVSLHSKAPTLATKLSFFVNMGNEYEVSVNDLHVINITQKQKDLPTTITLTKPTNVHSIRLRAINSDYQGMPLIVIRELNLFR